MFERTYTKLGISNYLKGIKSMISTEKTRKESLTKDKVYVRLHIVITYVIHIKCTTSDISKDIP